MLANKVMNNMPENSNSDEEVRVTIKFARIYMRQHEKDKNRIKNKTEENAQKYLNYDITWYDLVKS